MTRIQKYGIQFPITVNNKTTLFDLNKSVYDKVKSDLVHLIFTPEGQKLRDPLFGTKLIQYIFNPMDGQSFEDVELEIKDKVKKYVPKCEIINVVLTPTYDEYNLDVTIHYKVTNDGEVREFELTKTI